MVVPQGDPRLLDGEVAQRLLASALPARMARIAVRPAWVGVVDFQSRPPLAMGGPQPEAGGG